MKMSDSGKPAALKRAATDSVDRRGGAGFESGFALDHFFEDFQREFLLGDGRHVCGPEEGGKEGQS